MVETRRVVLWSPWGPSARGSLLAKRHRETFRKELGHVALRAGTGSRGRRDGGDSSTLQHPMVSSSVG